MNVPPDVVPPLQSSNNSVGSGSSGSNQNTGTCNCLHHKIDEYFTDYKVDFDFYDPYRFIINHLVVDTNCKTGDFASAVYKVALANGQDQTGNTISYKVAMDYGIVDVKFPITPSPCQYSVTIDYSASITWEATKIIIGGSSIPLHITEHFVSSPTFTFD